MKPDYKLVAKAKYIHMTADLASELWHEVYKRYYPAKQLDALVETLQSADAIEEDIDRDVNYFLVFLGDKLIGYFAWKMENTALHLLHIYLKPRHRGLLRAAGPRRGPGPRLLRGTHQVPAGAAVLQGAGLPAAQARGERGGRHLHAADRNGKDALKFPIAIFLRLYYTNVVQ